MPYCPVKATSAVEVPLAAGPERLLHFGDTLSFNCRYDIDCLLGVIDSLFPEAGLPEHLSFFIADSIV